LENVYKVNGLEYRLKEKYSAKDWGKLMLILSSLQTDSAPTFGMIGQLLACGNFEKLLNIILTGSAEITDVYDEDFTACSKAINDFFALKKNTIPNTA